MTDLPPIRPPVTSVVVTDVTNPPVSGAVEDTSGSDDDQRARDVERVLELVAGEAAALLLADDDGRLADLNVRTALASWDSRHQADDALRFLELAEGHPLAPRMRIAGAISSGSSEVLGSVERRFKRDRGALALELAEAWLWRHQRGDRAASILDDLLESELPPAWRAHVVELAALAHASAGTWTPVIALRSEQLGTDADPTEAAALAAIQLDRTVDTAAVLASCRAMLAKCSPGATNPLGWLRVHDIALDAAFTLDHDTKRELLESRAALVATLSGAELELVATRHALADELERTGAHDHAQQLRAQLAGAPAAQTADTARWTTQLRAVWSGDRNAAFAARRYLASASSSSVVAMAHAWRALEHAVVLGHRAAPELARVIASSIESPSAVWWIDLVELGHPGSQTVERLAARGGGAIRWAAAVAERLGDLDDAIALWQRALDAPLLPATRDHLIRLQRAPRSSRGAQQDRLTELYAAAARDETDPRAAAALWCGRGFVELSRGNLRSAEDSLNEAAKLQPRDVFCKAALAAVFRARRQHSRHARVLGELIGLLESSDGRATVVRERAEVLERHLDDRAGARRLLEHHVTEHPNDVDTLNALVELCASDRVWPRAIELATRAAQLAETPSRRADGWMKVARLEEQAGNVEAALAALDRAGTTNPAALREHARLSRDSGRADKAVAALRGALAGDLSIDRRMELQLELGRLLTQLDREPTAVVAAFLDVLAMQPDHAAALAGIEEPARKLGLWDELARAFRGAPQTPRNLDVLAEALEHTAEWAELAEVRRRQLEAATTPTDKAKRADELAKLYERELGDIDTAIRLMLLAQAAEPGDSRLQELLTLLRSAERWPELVTALEGELRVVAPSDLDRQVAILAELGGLWLNQLDRANEGLHALERALAIRPDHGPSFSALESIYEQAGRAGDLARIIEARAKVTADPIERAPLFARVAAIRHQAGDIDGSIAAFTAAFAADPTNRDVFTSLERVAYKAERWPTAMQLYANAILHVESGASRAYRLGDLYARRGNVQLNFLGDVDAAIESYQKVIEVDSQPAAAVKILEQLCRRQNNWVPLVTAYERRSETQRDPIRKAEAIRTAAKLAAKHLRDGEHSIRLNQKLLALDPMDIDAAHSLERLYESHPEKSGVVELLKLRLKTAKTVEQSVSLLRRIAQAAEEEARDVDNATEHYQKIIELEPDNREALDALARIYEATEQWAEFVDITRKQIKVTTDRGIKALLYFRCGSVMEAKFSREQDAIRYYDAAIKTAPTCLPAVHGLRDLYRRREEWPRVIETLEIEAKLWQDDKERAGVLAQIGKIVDHQLGDFERAMTYYQKALAVDPDCLPANQAVFEQLFEQGAWHKAQPIANALAERAMREGDPNTRSEFYRKRGIVSRMTGDPSAAGESFVVALEIKPTSVAALDDLGSLAREFPDAWDFEATYRELDKLYRRREDADALLARVHIGRAGIIEREGDLDQASELYRQAVALASADFTVVSALVDFHANMRQWAQAITATERFLASDVASFEERIAARMRLAALHADGELDPTRAIAALREVIKTDPAHQEAHYTLAQQYFLLGRFFDARNAIDRVIDLATAPGESLSPSALGRYYYYRGRILDALGDHRGSPSQYRRALEYDPGYAPPALVLARRAARAGDQTDAESILLEAAHAAMAQDGAKAAVPLQRGIAQILLAAGDRLAAIEAYRGIINVDPDSISDRLTLAELYAVDDLRRAIIELRKILDRDIHHAPAYRLLASYYERTGERERANRVFFALESLGFADDSDRVIAPEHRIASGSEPLRRPLSDDNRERFLVTPAARTPLGTVFTALAEQLSLFVSRPALGENLRPAQVVGEPRLLSLAQELGFLFQTDAEIFVGDNVPGLVAITAFPRRKLVVDQALLGESDVALRFLFGYAFDAIRGGYAVLLQLGARERRELATMLVNMLASEELTGPAAELVSRAGATAQQLVAQYAGTNDLDPAGWIDGMAACARRAGVIACDDFSAAIWMVARMSGEQLVRREDTIALGAVLGGPDLVRFYLSDEYQRLRNAIGGFSG
ncbi:MAG: tetratricopeptide repeat protein [Kofleriaceae bacterium]